MAEKQQSCCSVARTIQKSPLAQDLGAVCVTVSRAPMVTRESETPVGWERWLVCMFRDLNFLNRALGGTAVSKLNPILGRAEQGRGGFHFTGATQRAQARLRAAVCVQRNLGGAKPSVVLHNSLSVHARSLTLSLDSRLQLLAAQATSFTHLLPCSSFTRYRHQRQLDHRHPRSRSNTFSRFFPVSHYTPSFP